jgi:hypothetical protein
MPPMPMLLLLLLAAAAAAAPTVNDDPPSQDATNVAATPPTATNPPSQDATDATDATADDTFPISASYWATSPQARHLFQQRSEEPVEVCCLQCLVDILNSIFNNCSKLNQVVEGGEEMVTRLTNHQKQ